MGCIYLFIFGLWNLLSFLLENGGRVVKCYVVVSTGVSRKFCIHAHSKSHTPSPHQKEKGRLERWSSR